MLGFTLAEVLIVLGIIGIIANMTIPTLMENSRKQVYVTGLKKAYSTWSQALLQMAEDGGCPGDLSCFFDSDNFDLEPMGDKIVPYFQILKNCKTAAGCRSNTLVHNLDGTNVEVGVDHFGLYSFITTDGMSISFGGNFNGCNYDWDGLKNICMASFYVDVNGAKKPNALGRDVFQFVIDNDNGPVFYPYGGIKLNHWIENHDCDYGYEGRTTVLGSACSARIIEDGWKMNY